MQDDLTAAELSLHRRAIAKLKRKLFSRYSIADYQFIDGTEAVLSAHIDVLIRTWNNTADRRLRLGGVRYEFTNPKPEKRTWISIEHEREDRFCVVVSCEERQIASYTRFALTRSFKDIDETVYRCITDVRREDSQCFIKSGE